VCRINLVAKWESSIYAGFTICLVFDIDKEGVICYVDICSTAELVKASVFP